MSQVSRRRPVGVTRRQAKLNAVIGQSRMGFVGAALIGAAKKPEAVTRLAFSASSKKANFDARSMSTKSCLHLGHVDMKEADR